jgi:hypothetical protein
MTMTGPAGADSVTEITVSRASGPKSNRPRLKAYSSNILKGGEFRREERTTSPPTASNNWARLSPK